MLQNDAVCEILTLTIHEAGSPYLSTSWFLGSTSHAPEAALYTWPPFFPAVYGKCKHNAGEKADNKLPDF